MLPHIDKTIHPPYQKRQLHFGRFYLGKRESPESSEAFGRLKRTGLRQAGKMPKPYLPSSCCRLSCSLRRACLLAMRAGLSGSGTAVGMGSST